MVRHKSFGIVILVHPYPKYVKGEIFFLIFIISFSIIPNENQNVPKLSMYGSDQNFLLAATYLFKYFHIGHHMGLTVDI